MRTRIIVSLTMLVSVVLIASEHVSAQEAQAKVEVLGGFSFLNARTDHRENIFNASTGVAFNINRRFGLVLDVDIPVAGSQAARGLIGTLGIEGSARRVVTVSTDTGIHTALTGPRVSLRREGFNIFARGVIGVARLRREYTNDAELESEYFPPKYDETITRFAYGFGGGIDLDIGHRLALRAAQIDYIRSDFGWGANHVRIQTGVIFKLGRKNSD